MGNPPVPGLPKLPLILLGVLTVVTFGGPIVLLVVIQGGSRHDWPPDRAVEWWAFWLVIGLGIGLVTACIMTALRSRKGQG